jgi:dolichol-phosphate mannosyltransferase
MRPLVIVPTYNERENLESLVEAILGSVPTGTVLVVDDNSPDGTGAIARALAEQDDRVRLLHREGKQGLASAYLAGFRHALDRGFEAVCQIDADFSHDPADIPRLLAALETADVAVGSRWVRGGGTVAWPLSRRLLSRGGSLYARLMLGVPVHDLTGGFTCYRRSALARLELDALRTTGFGFQLEIKYACARAGLRLVEVPIIFRDRVRGRSKMSRRIFLEALLLVPRLRYSARPAFVGGRAA